MCISYNTQPFIYILRFLSLNMYNIFLYFILRDHFSLRHVVYNVYIYNGQI